MKYNKKSDSYQASNVTFHPGSSQAFSYNWWCFVKLIKGQLVFNAYRYSNTTAKHQYKVRALLRELGITIDREVQSIKGLQNITTLKELNAEENETLAMLDEREEYKRLRRNAKAKARRDARKAASVVKPALVLVSGGVES